jgi:hypothetical protein
LFFVSKQQWRHLGKGTQCGTVLREMLTKLFVRSYFQQNKLHLFYFLISEIATVSQKLKKVKAVIIICQTSNQIATMEESYCSSNLLRLHSKFVEVHVDASDIYPSTLIFYTRHRVNITIYRTVYLHTGMCKH